MENCKRCGRPQSAKGYCVEWRDGTCIRMESIIIEVKQ